MYIKGERKTRKEDKRSYQKGREKEKNVAEDVEKTYRKAGREGNTQKGMKRNIYKGKKKKIP